ncbi:hypothetical protein BCR34DRAFT_599360 [Clohesyomyces aquaticus]|uniref:Amidohydrolase-related domain-containing protein n=1 Tax=Clohesyomyces aquaticus TaxID=1231657 RepID=A0A1Y1ZWL0_9PLEO|nr:hypothetical protein BCR34DRAFT_599360 [Clohesyomyces aquaticus]
MASSPHGSKLLDTHIHLWPSTALSTTNHRWMTPGHILTRRHGVSDYNAITASTSPVQPTGFIYVETDRYLLDTLPKFSSSVVSESEAFDARQKLEQWAHEPLAELKFLRRIVEGTPEEGDGFVPGEGEKMLGCVIWAPFQLPAPLFELYMQIAEELSGPKLWERVVGFRYLLQGITVESEMRNLVEGEAWLKNILRLRKGREGKGWCFDVGVDAHRGGIWQMRVVADMVDRVREMEGGDEEGRVRFVLNHLSKPDLSSHPSYAPSLYLALLHRLSSQPLVYMKLSGALNEFSPDHTPSDIGSLLSRMSYELDAVFSEFGPRRIMFGSDWPVCNIGGPKGEGSWGFWREVVERILEEREVGEEEEGGEVWWRVGGEAYGVVV